MFEETWASLSSHAYSFWILAAVSAVLLWFIGQALIGENKVSSAVAVSETAAVTQSGTADSSKVKVTPKKVVAKKPTPPSADVKSPKSPEPVAEERGRSASKPASKARSGSEAR